MKNIKPIGFLICLLCFVNEYSAAQTTLSRHKLQTDSALKNWGAPGNFVLKGNIKNSKEKYFEFVTTDYFDNNENSVVIKSDGSFEQKFAVTNTQQIYLYLNNDALTFTVSKGDTIELAWDDKDFKNSFRIQSAQPAKNALLQTELKLYQNFREPFIGLLRDLSKNKAKYTADEKFALISTQYNEKIKTIFSEIKKYPNLEKQLRSTFTNLIVGEYFTYASLLRQEDLLSKPLTIKEDSTFVLPKEEVKMPDGSKRTFDRYAILDGRARFKGANEHYFTNVPEYRSFLYGYIRGSRLFNTNLNLVNYRMGDEIPKSNYTEMLYYLGKANFSPSIATSSTLIGDWFISKSIIDGFGKDDFGHVEMVYNRFLPECRTNYFKEVLIKTYAAVKNLKPGLPAPAFTLKNESGKSVQLADFKGKVVYIDFWGVGCGPCIYEFENHTPKLQAKYKDTDVVFLNICVDSKEATWKEGIKKFKVEGINLIAEGWGKNPVCQAYNVNGIPHYVIINKDGTMADNNAPRPSGLLGNAKSQALDSALKKP